ncbi:MAG: LPS export ABC transporter periplasmic protein LptC [Pseudodesulfovibrio sp.]
MKGRPALFIAIFVIGLVLGVTIKAFFFSDPLVEDIVSDSGKDKSRKQLIDESAIVAEDIELVQGKQGAMTWKLLAKTAKYNQEKKLIGVERPQLTAFYGEDRQEVYVKADRGEIDQSDDNLTLYDNVTGRFGDLSLNAQHLDYIGAINKVYLKGGVTVRRPEMTFKAAAVEIDLVERQLVAAGGVEALLAPKGFEEIPFNE